ncbi:cell-cycle control medial ring component [Phaeosphaeria sp. MPI-PUGE-AT-0046c]|nr:cell-cycle control medial ring component [Phaeosphaeria sp. MPI-PUGE-AT-0046c]
MSEVAFCKTFLTALDARPAKLSSDHIADARQFDAAVSYTLPRLPHPPHPQRPAPKSAQNAASTLSISLKPMKSSFPTVPLSSIDAAKTSIFDLKSQYATQSSIPAAKIKILYKKKPVTDSKTVADVIGQDAGGEVEFGVMIMGGATASPAVGTPVTSPPAVAPSEAEKGLAGASTDGGPAAQGPSGKQVVATDEFWHDLKGFIMQRTRDETEAERLAKMFRGAWESSK